MTLVYANRTQLVDYTPEKYKARTPSEPEATRLLTSASKEIRNATKTAIYDTDTDGYPTDTEVRQAFRDACCAQALWWLDNPGLETGAAVQYQSVSIGSVTLSRGNSAGATLPRFAPMAGTELANAGVLPGAVISGWW